MADLKQMEENIQEAKRGETAPCKLVILCSLSRFVIFVSLSVVLINVPPFRAC